MMKNKALLMVVAAFLVMMGCGEDNNNGNVSVCGNGTLEGTEQCDDGNTIAGDGCNATCNIENNNPSTDNPSTDNPSTDNPSTDNPSTDNPNPDEPGTTGCPVDGSACSNLLENKCCDGKLYYCNALDSKWHMQECLTGTVCDAVTVDFGGDFPTTLSQCVESCDAANEGKVIDYGSSCYEDNSFDLYVCQKSITGNYRAFRGTKFALGYCVDDSHKAICNGENVEEIDCESCKKTTSAIFTDATCENIPTDTTPSVGDKCAKEDDGNEVCGKNNTRLECVDGTYEQIESCSGLGENYYCDVQAETGFVACVLPCDASQKGQVTGYTDCFFGYVMVNTCELGKSGQYGSFGGLAGEQVCSSDGTKLVTCNDAGEFVETLCTSGCNMSWDAAESAYLAACK